MLGLVGLMLIIAVVLLFLFASVGVVGLAVGVAVGILLIAFDRGYVGGRGV
jgi:hypothetical protein